MEETTSSWSSRRKSIYLWSAILALTLLSVLVFYKFWYKAPTCFDNFQNGDETGIDCGGSCALVCSAEALPPIIRSDPRIFEVYPGVYSLVTFVENHNLSFEADSVPYTFNIYGDGDSVIAERRGFVKLAKNKKIAVFEGGINSTSTPKRVSFELSKNIIWTKDINETPEIELLHSPLLNASTSPKINATIANKSLTDLQNIEIITAVFDSKDNAIAASRTFVDRLRKDEKSDIFFTWPKSFVLEKMFCEKPSSVALAIDRSGSMASIKIKPPEPLESVKLAATDFISNLKDSDSAGLISFATEASSPPDSLLTTNFGLLKEIISNIQIKTDGTQYTNIADAISKSKELLSTSEEKNNKIIILLTDGLPTNQNGDTTNAEAKALEEAEMAKQDNVNIYTIGLGQDVNQNFLKAVASIPEQYFFAPTANNLKSIYKEISSAICTEVPARIEMFVSL